MFRTQPVLLLVLESGAGKKTGTVERCSSKVCVVDTSCNACSRGPDRKEDTFPLRVSPRQSMEMADPSNSNVTLRSSSPGHRLILLGSG